jgi:nicotinate-nucleotide adenylyltransferase
MRKRLQLARLAVEGKPHLRVSDFEFSMPRPSYTYDTLAAIEQRYPEHKFTLVIGADNWYIFPRWYMAEKILASHDMLIYPREECPIDRENAAPKCSFIRITDIANFIHRNT